MFVSISSKTFNLKSLSNLKKEINNDRVEFVVVDVVVVERF